MSAANGGAARAAHVRQYQLILERLEQQRSDIQNLREEVATSLENIEAALGALADLSRKPPR